jgi:hypothetical protein
MKNCFGGERINMNGPCWTEDLQEILKKHSSDKEPKKYPAWKLLNQKAAKWDRDLSSIQRLKVQFRSYKRASFNEEEKQAIIDEAARLIQVMGDIASYLNSPIYTELIKGSLHDIKKGGLQKRSDGSCFLVHKNNLSKAQEKLTPLAYCFVHPSPVAGSSSHKIITKFGHNIHDPLISEKDQTRLQ